MPEVRRRVGLTVPFTGVPLHEHPDLYRRAEAAGYDDLWSGETANGADGFTPLTLAAATTERMRLVTGIVNPFTRGIGLLAQSAASLQEASNGRFVLGLGASSDVIVERFNGMEFSKPLSRVRDAVEHLRPVLSVPAERGFGGMKLERPVAATVPIVLAALRGGMLRLAAEVADGAFTNFLPLSGLPRVLEALRPPVDFEVACRFFLFPQPAEQALGFARLMFSAYASVPVYTEFFRWLGWGEQIDPMVEAYRAGDRPRAAELAPEGLMREIFIFGEPAAARERLAAYAAGGITTLILTLIAPPEHLPALIEGFARA